MSAGYLPPVVVQITGDIRNLLGAISDAETALTQFAQGTYDATLTATRRKSPLRSRSPRLS